MGKMLESVQDAGKMRDLMQKAYLNGEFTDLTIEFQGTALKVHKVVVCGQSKVLHAMCTSGFKESATDTISFSEDADMDAHQLQCLIDYFYGNKYGTFPESKPPTTVTIVSTDKTSSQTTSVAGSGLFAVANRASVSPAPQAARASPSSSLFGGASSTPAAAANRASVSPDPQAIRPSPPSSLFGQPRATPAPAGTAGSFFGSAQPASTTTTSSLFGSFGPPPTTTTTVPTRTSSLFGGGPAVGTSSPASSSSTFSTSGGLFGSALETAPSHSSFGTSALSSQSAATTTPKPAAKATIVTEKTVACVDPLAVDKRGNKLSAKFHAQMYALADRYDIKGLDSLAKSMYEKSITLDPKKFLDTVIIVYTGTPDSNKGLRNIAAIHMKKNIKHIADKKALREIIEQVPSFAADVFDLFP